MEFDTKVAIVVAEDLAQWQKLNVVAFLTSGVMSGDGASVGEPYRDGSEAEYLPLFAGASELFGKLGRDQSELPGLGQELLGNLRRFVTFASDRPHGRLRELVHRLAGDLLLFGRLERDHDVLLCRFSGFDTWWK